MKAPKKAGDVMIRKIIKVQPQMNIYDASVLLLKHQISSAPVVTPEGVYLGEFSEQSCLEALFHSVFEESPDNHVRSYVEPWTQTLETDDDLVIMVEEYHETTQRILPVIEDDHIIGIVTRSQIIRTVVDYLKKVPDRQARVLYLSALRKKDPPAHLLES